MHKTRQLQPLLTNITQQNPMLRLVTQFEINAKPSNQVFRMSSTSFHTSSSVKNMKSTADAGKRRSSFRERVRCKAQFATVTFCARRFFKAFQLLIWRTIWYTKKWWIYVSREICCVVLYLFGAPFWLKINSLTESKLSSVRALRGRPLHWHLLVLPAFLNFLYNLFRPETVQSLPENSLISF